MTTFDKSKWPTPDAKPYREVPKSKSSHDELTNSVSENELPELSWPLSGLRSCSKPGAGLLFSKCRKCNPIPNPQSLVDLDLLKGPSSKPTNSGDDADPNPKPKCYCARVTLKSAGNSSSQQHCLNYVQQLNDPYELSIDSERECGTTRCEPPADDKHRGACSFPILATDMPTHVPVMGGEESGKLRKMRHSTSMPLFCSGQVWTPRAQPASP